MFKRIGIKLKNSVLSGLYTIKITFNPENVNLYWQRGLLYFKANKYAIAIKDFTKVIQLSDSYTIAYCYRGSCYTKIQNWIKSIEDYSKVVELTFEKAETYLTKTERVETWFSNIVFNYDDKIGDSISINEKFEFNSEIPEVELYLLAYLMRGINFYALGHSTEAIENLTVVIKFNFNNSLACFCRGLAYNSLQNFNEAIEDFSEVIKVNPTFSLSYQYRAYAYYSIKEYDKAIQDYTKAIELNPENEDAYLIRADCYEIIGNYLSAINDYTKIIQLNQNVFSVLISYINRSLCYHRIEKYDEILRDIVIFEKELKNLLKTSRSSFDFITSPFTKITNKRYENMLGKDFLFSTESISYLARKYSCNLIKEPLTFEDATIRLSSFYSSILSNEQALREGIALLFLQKILLISNLTLFAKVIGLLFNFKIHQDTMKIWGLWDQLLNKQMPEDQFKKLYIEIDQDEDSQNCCQEWLQVLAKDGKDLFLIQFKKALLRYFSEEFSRRMSVLPKKIRATEGFSKQANFMYLLSLFNNVLQDKYIELVEQKEQEKTLVKIEEKNRLLQTFSHTLKNTFSKSRAPLENLKSQYRDKNQEPPSEINSTLKQLEKMEKLARLIDFSFKGNVEDIYYDIQHNEHGKSLKQMTVEALENAVENILDKSGVYSQYASKYFKLTQKREARQLFYRDYIEYNLASLQAFFDKYLLALTIDFGEAATWILGDAKHSATKYSILLDELIFNAVKYASFVERNKRFLHIAFLSDYDKLILIVENSYLPVENEQKTSGIGHEIVKNIVNTIEGRYQRKAENDVYNITIILKNFWKEMES